jgi:predicted dehydrogenase
MSNPIRVGIIGCGFAAEFHYNSYQRVTGLEVKVVGITSLTREHQKFLPRNITLKPLIP